MVRPPCRHPARSWQPPSANLMRLFWQGNTAERSVSSNGHVRCLAAPKRKEYSILGAPSYIFRIPNRVGNMPPPGRDSARENGATASDDVNTCNNNALRRRPVCRLVCCLETGEVRGGH